MPSPQFDQLLKLFAANPLKEGTPLADLRAGYERLGAMFAPPAGTEFTPVQAGGVPACWVRAEGVAASSPVLLYLHGGGYVIGSLKSHRHLMGRLSAAAGARVLGLDYRLAPEFPHPAALDDATAAYRWLLASGGIDHKRIAIAGDSAGGGLTAATLVKLRESRDPLPAAAVFLSPWTDLAAEGKSLETKAGVDPMVQRKGLVEMAGHYLAGRDPKAPLCSPIYADLSGLPPFLVHVGTRETLFDDAERLAGRARAAGVDVTFEPWQDMIHVWHFFAPMLPEANEAIERVGRFLREHF